MRDLEAQEEAILRARLLPEDLEPSSRGALERAASEELEAVRALDHPGLVIPSRTWQASDWVLTLQMEPGQALARALEHPPELTRPLVLLRHVLELLDGLCHAHEHGVVHGDIHLGHVLVRPDASWALTGFGLGAATSACWAAGIPSQSLFTSPEVRRGAPPSIRSDLWSMAAAIRSLGAVWAAHSEAAATLALLHTLTEALHEDPARRPESAAVLREQLLRLDPNQAPRPAPPAPQEPEQDPTEEPPTTESVLDRALSNPPPQRWE